MIRSAIALSSAGLCLLGLSAWLVPSPRLNPRPDLPDIPPFAAGERIALILPNPGRFPPADDLALVRRARAAGAEVRIFASDAGLAGFVPDRILQPAAGPETPTGYHPDQWPTRPSSEDHSANDWQQLVLTPEEQTAKNAAILATARSLPASSADDAHGTRAAEMLSRARRAEIYLVLAPSDLP